MQKAFKAAVAGIALLAGSAVPAMSADIVEIPIEYEKKVEFKGSWYLRGHIGMSNQRLGTLYNVLMDAPTTNDLVIVDKNFEAGPTIGVGVGYVVNDYLRVDGLVEYRGEVGFHGLDTWTDELDNARFNNYSGKKSELLFMANAYVDIAEFHGIIPYVGAGIGASRNVIHSFRDEGIDGAGNPTLGIGGRDPTWNLAWALHTGLGFKVTEKVTLDLGYSFLHLGDAKTSDLVAYDGTDLVDNPMHFRNITSHDFKLGMRYAF
jgi:opacity protein-like surface antigen